MTLNMIVGILGGVCFLIFGVGGVMLSSKKKWRFYFPLIIGIWVLYIHLLGPLSDSNKMLDRVINLESDNVQIILIKPSKSGGNEGSLILNNIEIKNKESINVICETLNESKKVYDGYVKQPEWSAILEIRQSAGNVNLGIRKRQSKTAIKVTSNGENGWNYGTLKCDRLSQVLEEFIYDNNR